MLKAAHTETTSSYGNQEKLPGICKNLKKTKNTERLTEALEQISVCTRNNSSKITNLFFTCSSYTVERDMLV